MPRPFQQLSVEQFNDLLQQFPFRRQIDSVHMHHTWRPNRSMYKGLATIEAMYQFHTVENGWSDIAQHITIAPDGTIWTGRSWNDPPASATGFNGNREHGPFMFEMVGDFDGGKDPFEAPQRDTAIAVVALVQERFGLPLESLRFHNQMTTVKTCPGNSLQRDDILAAVREKRQAVTAQPVGRGFAPGEMFESIRGLSSAGVRQDELLAETSDDAMQRGEEYFYSGDAGYVQPLPGSRGFASTRGFGPQDLSALRPYVVSMRQGRWDTSGIFNSTAGDVEALFFEHAKAALDALPKNKKLRFVLYAHGGLVSEQNGLEQARQHIEWWNQSGEEGIYPIYFIWKTGLGETIAQLLGLAHPAAKELAAASREFITDPVIAGIARRLGGEALWSGMKRDAEQAVLPNGVATFVAQQMKKFCDQYHDRVELHAAGHSAGSVFHSHFIPLSTVTGNPHFITTSFMAPAVRADTFLELLTMDDGAGRRVLKPEVGDLTLFTMKKDYEKKDDCAGIYGQSLLYLIYHALEPADRTPLLGLEESIRSDARLTAIFGLGASAATGSEVVWSPSLVESGRSATRAIHHGDFTSDAPSLNSILRRVLSLSDTDPIHSFPSGARGLDDIWDIWAAPNDLPGFSAIPAGSPSAPASSPSGSPVRSTSGRKRALCVGIDNYAAPNRLNGCVNDAHSWSDTLHGLGFDTTLLLDQNASYAGMTAALRDLVTSSQAGDVIVFQYSGHGTTMPDETGRTVDGVEEAMVPADFSQDNPVLLMDFDVASIFNALPQGVNLTCFIDCCHSGTITRLLVGLTPQRGAQGADERPRYIVLTPEQTAAVRRYRSTFAATARGSTIGGQARMRDIVFSACQPDEVSWEVNGHGDFTRIATGVLSRGVVGTTNDQFAASLTQEFGAGARQHPLLDCAPPAKSKTLLQP